MAAWGELRHVVLPGRIGGTVCYQISINKKEKLRLGKEGFNRATIFSIAIFICTRTILSDRESSSAISLGFIPSSRANRKIRRHLSGSSPMAWERIVSISWFSNLSSGDSLSPMSGD